MMGTAKQKAPKVAKPRIWRQLRPSRPGKKPKAKKRGRSIPPCTPAQQERQDRARELGCVACLQLRLPLEWHCGRIEIHHQNQDGKAGQKQLGQDFTVALGAWHHRGTPLPGWTARQMLWKYDHSLARASVQFRETFGTDAQQLDYQNELLRGHR
jgi:hypothetical protein